MLYPEGQTISSRKNRAKAHPRIPPRSSRRSFGPDLLVKHPAISEDIFQKAVSRALEKGWEEAILTYVETPFAIFECGYCTLALITEEMYRAPDGMYRSDETLCEMASDGEIYVERPEPPAAEPHPWEYDGLDLIEDALCGNDVA